MEEMSDNYYLEQIPGTYCLEKYNHQVRLEEVTTAILLLQPSLRIIWFWDSEISIKRYHIFKAHKISLHAFIHCWNCIAYQFILYHLFNNFFNLSGSKFLLQCWYVILLNKIHTNVIISKDQQKTKLKELQGWWHFWFFFRVLQFICQDLDIPSLCHIDHYTCEISIFKYWNIQLTNLAKSHTIVNTQLHDQGPIRDNPPPETTLSSIIHVCENGSPTGQVKVDPAWLFITRCE